MLITDGTSFTFRTASETKVHCNVLAVLLGLSFLVKLLLVIVVAQPRQSCRAVSFALLTISDSTLPLIDAVATSELLLLTNDNQQMKPFLSIGFLNLLIGFLFRLLNELSNGSYLLINSSPGKRLPCYWNVILTEALLLAVTLQFSYLSLVDLRPSLALSSLALVLWNCSNPINYCRLHGTIAISHTSHRNYQIVELYCCIFNSRVHCSGGVGVLKK